MRPLLVEPEAEEELADAVDWYEERESGLGAALLAQVDRVIARLRRGDPIDGPVPGVRAEVPARRARVTRFPYWVVFVPAEERLHVVAFAHERRRPGYWRYRV